MSNPLLACGIGLWMGEGFKVGPSGRKTDNRIAIGSADPIILLLFLGFLDAIGIDTSLVGARVVIPRYPGLASGDAVTWWKTTMGFTDDQMANPGMEKPERKRQPKYPNGTCTIYTHDLEGRVKINIWTQMMIDSVLSCDKGNRPSPQL